MKKISFYFIPVFLFFLQNIKAECPGIPECNDILTSVAFSLEEYEEGSCIYKFMIEGVDEAYWDCITINVTATPISGNALPPNVSLDNPSVPVHWNVTPNHLDSDPVDYVFVISLTWNEPGQFCLPTISHVHYETIQCEVDTPCPNNDDTGVVITSDRGKCDEYHCQERLQLAINNLNAVNIEWTVSNGSCSVPSIPNGAQNPDIILDACPEPYVITVMVTDEDGCVYMDVIEINCFGCGIPCDPEENDVVVNIFRRECLVNNDEPDGTVCYFILSIKNLNPNSNLYWTLTSPNGVSQYISGNPGYFTVISDGSDPHIGSATVIEPETLCEYTIPFELSCPAGCDEDVLDVGGDNSKNLNPLSNNNTIYPNPISLSISNILKINNDFNYSHDASISVEIMNISGQTLKHINLNKNSDDEINMDGITPGIYFIKISDGNELMQVEKIIVME